MTYQYVTSQKHYKTAQKVKLLVFMGFYLAMHLWWRHLVPSSWHSLRFWNDWWVFSGAIVQTRRHGHGPQGSEMCRFLGPTSMRIYVTHNYQTYIGTLIEIHHSSRVYYRAMNFKRTLILQVRSDFDPPKLLHPGLGGFDTLIGLVVGSPFKWSFYLLSLKWETWLDMAGRLAMFSSVFTLFCWSAFHIPLLGFATSQMKAITGPKNSATPLFPWLQSSPARARPQYLKKKKKTGKRQTTHNPKIVSKQLSILSNSVDLH